MRPTNTTPSDALPAEANGEGIHVSGAVAQGLVDAVREGQAKRWQAANAAGFEAWNRYVERQGVPLAHYRKF